MENDFNVQSSSSDDMQAALPEAPTISQTETSPDTQAEASEASSPEGYVSRQEFEALQRRMDAAQKWREDALQLFGQQNSGLFDKPGLNAQSGLVNSNPV